MNEFQQERKEWAKYQRTLEKQLLPIFRKALKKSIDPAITYANVFGVNFDPTNIINRNVWQSTYLNIFDLIGMKSAKKEFYRQRTMEGMENKASAIDFLVDVWSGKLRDFATNYAFFISDKLNETTVKILNQSLSEAYELGLDKDDQLRLFELDVNKKMKLRSLTMSRTESTTISNLGKDIGARGWIEQQGGQGYKVWLGRNDARERPSHLDENDRIIEIDDLFNLDGELCQRPGDLSLSLNEKINCRCTASYMSINRYNGLKKRNRIIDGKIVN